MTRLLRHFVCAESPSFDKAAVDHFGRMVAEEWRRRGARVSLLRQRQRGDHVRAANTQGMHALERKFRALRPILPGAKIEGRGGFNRPPMERKASAALYAKARAVACEMGLDLGEDFVGGGSDGNFTAALGIPTLDGLGEVGEGAHSSHESIVLRALSERAALLAGLLSIL